MAGVGPWREELERLLYFDTSHAVLQGALDHDLLELEEAVRRLGAHLTGAATDTGAG